ncbi:hypothetical protein DMUE_4501 [Dictyocoela muelleri]|nr:hypothetical protein DMUE_4501 [Dictyocoela muelleri]
MSSKMNGLVMLILIIVKKKLNYTNTKQTRILLNNNNLIHNEISTFKQSYKTDQESAIDQNKHLNIFENNKNYKQSKYPKLLKFRKELSNDEKIKIKKTFEDIFNEIQNKSYSSDNFCYKIPSHK